jgi:hypothetical protein
VFYPPRAQQAATEATTSRQRYHQAVAQIRENRDLSMPDKRRQLKALHAAHAARMQELRQLWQRAFADAEYSARKRLYSDPSIRQHRMVQDSYLRHLERLAGKSTPELAAEFERAQLIDDEVVMRAVAVTALERRVPGPGDQASRLVARFAYARESDGHGHLRYRFAQAAGAWEELTGLEEWDSTASLNALGAFSVPSTPERAEEPRPRDPDDVAREAVAVLYTDRGGPPISTQNGAGGADAPAAP